MLQREQMFTSFLKLFFTTYYYVGFLCFVCPLHRTYTVLFSSIVLILPSKKFNVVWEQFQEQIRCPLKKKNILTTHHILLSTLADILKFTTIHYVITNGRASIKTLRRKCKSIPLVRKTY